MDKRKTIIVWMDGKKTKLKQSDNPTNKPDETYSFKELAATKESHSDSDPIPTYIRQNTFEDEIPLKNGRNRKAYKQIFVAGFSAILLGIGLGIFMLNMFTNIGPNAINEKLNPLSEATNGTTENGSGNAVVADTSTYTVEGIEAFVLQAGVFSGETNASVIEEKFSSAGFPTMTWKHENKYYLFANIAETEALVDSKIAQYKALNLETYAKKWTTSDMKLELTEAEHKWLQSFHSLWNNGLTKVSNNNSIVTDDWIQWIEAYPEKAKNTNNFYKNVKSLQEDIQNADQTTSPTLLLKLWNEYANLIK